MDDMEDDMMQETDLSAKEAAMCRTYGGFSHSRLNGMTKREYVKALWWHSLLFSYSLDRAGEHGGPHMEDIAHDNRHHIQH